MTKVKTAEIIEFPTKNRSESRLSAAISENVKSKARPVTNGAAEGNDRLQKSIDIINQAIINQKHMVDLFEEQAGDINAGVDETDDIHRRYDAVLSKIRETSRNMGSEPLGWLD